MSLKAVTYAENKLGVHQVLQNAVDAQHELDGIFNDLDRLHENKRACADKVQDREVAVYVEERTKHTEMSATALDAHVKNVRREDKDLVKLREETNNNLNSIQGLEYDAEIQRNTIKMSCARMEQLGGYLNYLAAIKNADKADKAIKALQQETE